MALAEKKNAVSADSPPPHSHRGCVEVVMVHGVGSELLGILVASHKGKPLPLAQRRKMSDAHKRRGTRPPAAGVPWTDADESLLGKIPDVDVVKRTGRTLEAVRSRRYVRGIPKFKNK